MVRAGKTLLALGGATLALCMPSLAHATDGYFQNGISIRSKGQAGAGIAAPATPLSIADNPAGIAEIDSQVEIGASLFMPRRQFDGSGGPGFTPSGVVKSGSDYFVLPNAAVSYKLDDQSAVGFALYGNGGLNTNYGPVSNPACAMPGLPATNGTFCGGAAGVNLMQMFISAAYSRKIGDMLTVGVAPVFGMQIFKARGLAAFSYDMMGNPLTGDPSKLTNNGNSVSTGVGVRVGVLLKLAPQFRLGASYQTKMAMSRFGKYAGLFEDGGKFDIPSNFTIGAAFSPTPNITLMTDYRHINYSDVAAVSNSSTIPAQFGSKGGPGFGWKNVDEFKVGLEVKPAEGMALRGGVSFNNNPVTGGNATINILAPGVSTRHYTLGATIPTGKRSMFDVSALYSPRAHTTGIEITPAGANPGHLIDLSMKQFEIGVAWRLKF